MAIDLPKCVPCGHVDFPPHLLCSRCGADEWTVQATEGGTLEHVTYIRRSLTKSATEGTPAIGLVRTDPGPYLLARVKGDVEAGQPVALGTEGGAIVATPR